MKKIYTYDSTLRDGMQAEGISFSVEDKIKIVKKLDSLGIDYIEAGNPGSNPKDLEFFRRVNNLKLKHTKICAFGSTHRVGVKVEEDANVTSLLRANTSAVAIFGKAWDLHVTDVLKTDLNTNLELIYNTVKFFKDHGKEVVFDAEHFFDGYKANAAFARECVKTAVEAGADWVVLCDTNGGAFPDEVGRITESIVREFPVKVGIHCHNDTGMAVASSIFAVKAGAVQVQGTMNGIGERCGNANLCSVVPNLQLKLGYKCLDEGKISLLTGISRYISEIANISHDERQPYVGGSAFAHKGGMHVDGVLKNPKTFEHISPETVGNSRRFLISEMSGRANLITAIQNIDPTLDKNSPQTSQIIDKLKTLEFMGYQFEGAESSMELLIRKELERYKPFFGLNQFKVIVSEPSGEEYSSSALIKIHVDDMEDIAAAEGDGPVNALDKALRRVLERFYPQISEVRLTDYKVRVLDGQRGTASKVRVLIESTDGRHSWSTVGVSTDIIEASWHALVDSVEYKLLLDSQEERK